MLIRTGTSFIPELSLVAEINGNIVGHIMFTKLQIQNDTILALAPLSVLPEYQRQGIGSALIKEGHQRAKDLGYIKSPFEIPNENFMALKLNKEAHFWTSFYFLSFT